MVAIESKELYLLSIDRMIDHGRERFFLDEEKNVVVKISEFGGKKLFKWVMFWL